MLGSGFLTAVVIGSGIAAQRLSPGDTGLELLENAAATAAGLFAIILMFGQVSGGHFNPVVSFADAAFGGLSWRDAACYLPAQVTGCLGGAVIANLMFSGPAVSISSRNRASAAHFLSEIVATLGLLLVIFALARSGRSRSVPAAAGAYIGAAYFFTSSTSFANPAITFGRMFSDTFAGIAPASVPAFIGAQVIGGALAVAVILALYPGTPAATGGACPFLRGRCGRCGRCLIRHSARQRLVRPDREHQHRPAAVARVRDATTPSGGGGTHRRLVVPAPLPPARAGYLLVPMEGVGGRDRVAGRGRRGRITGRGRADGRGSGPC